MDGWTNYWTRTSYPGTTIQILLELFKTREEKKAENQRREAAQAVKRTLKKSIADMESTIATLEKKQARLALDLEHPSTYANPNTFSIGENQPGAELSGLCVRRHNDDRMASSTKTTNQFSGKGPLVHRNKTRRTVHQNRITS